MIFFSFEQDYHFLQLLVVVGRAVAAQLLAGKVVVVVALALKFVEVA